MDLEIDKPEVSVAKKDEIEGSVAVSDPTLREIKIEEKEPQPEPEPEIQPGSVAVSDPTLRVIEEENKEIEADKNIESSKPKKKRERTEKQKAVFEKARLKRQENIAKRKAEKEANKKPVGRPKKTPQSPVPTDNPSLNGMNEDLEITDTEEEVIYMKKPKEKKAPKKKKKIVYVSSSESSDEEIIYKPKPKKNKQSRTRKTKVKPEPEYFSSESDSEEEYVNYHEPQPPQLPTSISQFYRIA